VPGGGGDAGRKKKKRLQAACFLFSLRAIQSPPETNIRFSGQIQQKPNATS